MKRFFFITFFIVFIFGCENPRIKEVNIFYAGSLAKPIYELKQAFETKYPEYKVILEASGSRACCRKITDLNRNADIIFSADYNVFDDLLIPEYTEWYISFATNSLVIAYTDHSKYADEVNVNNWFDILNRKDVNFGYSDPNLDPAGYRTLMCWQLSEKYYGKNILTSLNKACKLENIRPSSVQLLSMLQNYLLDYAFEYKSICIQHHLKFIQLPDEINLSNPVFSSNYEKAVVRVNGKIKDTFSYVKGTPIKYAFTILKQSKNKNNAIKFLDFLFSHDGKKIFSDNQTLLSKPITNNIKNVPAKLKKYIK